MQLPYYKLGIENDQKTQFNRCAFTLNTGTFERSPNAATPHYPKTGPGLTDR